MVKQLLWGFITALVLFYGGNVGLQGEESSYPEKIQKAAFQLVIKEIPEIKGEIRIAIFDSEEKYQAKEDPVYALVLPVKAKELNWEEKGLPYGKYAIAVYHDENENGELDTNILGIPKEAYGFSNGAKGRFGPASWKDAAFEVNESSQKEIIRLR